MMEFENLHGASVLFTAPLSLSLVCNYLHNMIVQKSALCAKDAFPLQFDLNICIGVNHNCNYEQLYIKATQWVCWYILIFFTTRHYHYFRPYIQSNHSAACTWCCTKRCNAVNCRMHDGWKSGAAASESFPQHIPHSLFRAQTTLCSLKTSLTHQKANLGFWILSMSSSAHVKYEEP